MGMPIVGGPEQDPFGVMIGDRCCLAPLFVA
jgi:hypothetical protein